MSGLAATEYVMAHCPTPILIVSSSVNRGELFQTYEALAAGAVDVMEKPGGNDPAGTWEQRFVSTVKLVARIRVITHPRARLDQLALAHRDPSTTPRLQPRPGSFDVVAMGASTGGPSAIVEVLRALPPTFVLPVLLVLHVGEPFSSAFADWLDGQTERRVAYARNGQTVSSAVGQVIMAPPDRHLVVRDLRLWLTDDPERHSCRPSVDVLFESVAKEYGASGVACLLTGMGRDGAAGLSAIRQTGGLTIAQDEATCVVYGMPREAVLLGAVQHLLPLGEIGRSIVALAASDRGERR
jgi:two-component system chemotaxis response regulator CheB